MNTENQNDNIIDGAISEVKKPDNALVIMDPLKFATELFQPYHDQLASAKRSAARMKYDVATKDGMAKAKELRAAFVTIRTTADKAKTEAKRPIDQSGKLILEHYRKLEEAAKAEEAKHDKAIKDEEARIEAEKQRKLAEERARIEAIEQRINHIRNIPVTLAQADSETIAAKLEELMAKRLEPSMYDDHLEEAVNALNTTVDTLRELHAKAIAYEAEAKRIAEERAELARLKAEQEARERAEKEAEAERQRQMAEMRAQQEAAAAAMKRQQDQMNAIMEIQGLAAALAAAGQDGDDKAIESALAKAVAFNPDDFGPMTAMAKMARDAAVPLLEDLLLNVPLSKPTDVETRMHDGHVLGQPINSAGQYYSRTTFNDNGNPILCNADGSRSIFCDVDDMDEPEPAQYSPTKESMNIIGIDMSPMGDSAVVIDLHAVHEPMRAEPAPIRPSDDDLIELVMREYGESRKTSLDWLAEINFAAAYDKIA